MLYFDVLYSSIFKNSFWNCRLFLRADEDSMTNVSPSAANGDDAGAGPSTSDRPVQQYVKKHINFLFKYRKYVGSLNRTAPICALVKLRGPY